MARPPRRQQCSGVEFDVIVIGAGLSGRLPAAAYLQKAGLSVLVVEANAEAGTFCCTRLGAWVRGLLGRYRFRAGPGPVCGLSVIA